MAKDFAKKFYNSKEWYNCRESYIVLVHGLCETCTKKEKITPGYILHHKILLTPSNIGNPVVTLNHEHLMYQCLDCHNREHGSNVEVIRDGLTFNSYGDVIPVSPP